MCFPPRIAIIGAGPAGLTLGVLLHKRGVPFTIFDRRQQPTAEELAAPCGMLDLHEESGIAALKECGLYDQFLKLTGECEESQRICDKAGNILYASQEEQNERPEISRHALTRLLNSHLPAQSIKWGQKLVSVASKATPTGTETELDFGPNGKQTVDLVVGADGAWSQVRKLLTDVKPHYAGTQNITLTIRNISAKYPHLAELIGRGSFWALGDRHGVITQRGPQNSARIYLMITSPDDTFHMSLGLAGRTAAAAKDILLNNNALIGGWGPTIKDLVAVACDEETNDNPGGTLDIKPLYTLPIGMSWEHASNATIIGDAAHLMCPWAGEGVNLAMWDSLLLSRAILHAYETVTSEEKGSTAFQTTLDPLLREFEAEMLELTKEKAEETQGNGETMFGEDGAKKLAQFFLSMGQ